MNTPVPGTAIFMARDIERVPVALMHAMKHFKVLHRRSVLMTVVTEDMPHVPEAERVELKQLGKGFIAMRVRYGFMDEPNIVAALEHAPHFPFNLMDTSFVIGRQKLLPGRRLAGLAGWRKQLFILMANNALDATEYFRVPANRAVELGGQVEI